MKPLAIVFGLIPGLGQILLNRSLRGIFFFFFFVLLLDFALVIVPFVPFLKAISFGVSKQCGIGFTDLTTGLLICAAIIWCYNLWDIIRIIYWRERSSLRERKKTMFQEALRFYLQGKFTEARNELRKILKLDRDDPDILFYLGMVFSHLGQNGKARRCFRKSLALDVGQKWSWEIKQVLNK